jgi:hypothetical protein
MLAHPNFAALSCAMCEKVQHVDGVISYRNTTPRTPNPRLKGQVTPCWKCPKIPDEAPRKTRPHAIEMSYKNRAAYLHYRECSAVGSFPDDPIVRRNAGVIRGVIDSLAEARIERVMVLLGGLISRAPF